MTDEKQSFWDHVDELRMCLWRILFAIVLGSIAAFFLKDLLFRIILAPCHDDFLTYRLLGADSFSLHLINTQLAEQMMIHLKVAFFTGCLLVSPYIIYVLFRFISPALYDHERRYTSRIALSAYVMFLLGVMVNYLLVFPLTVRFLGLYQVSSDIDNMLTLSSYIETLLMMSLIFGIVFEIPVLSWLLAKLGLLKAQWMVHYRRHAFVIILIISAIITPTADIFTLFIVALPIWLLFEMSIQIVRRIN